ncbi:MAG: MFS transporter [Alistipes sp.]|nr:MFS transporter [Alistipes sp.]
MNRSETNRIYPWVVVALLWVVALLSYMDRQMLATMCDAMALDIAELRDKQNFGFLMACFLYIYAPVSPLAGVLADRINRKWLIVVSLGVWSAVTLAMGHATTFRELCWLRGLMGVSEAIYIPTALSLIADYFSGSARSLAIGIHMTGLYVGQAAGGFGAMAASSLSWQQTFHWCGVAGIVYALVLVAALREKPRVTAASVGMPAGEPVWRSFSLIFSNAAFWTVLFFFASLSAPGWATKNWLPELFSSSLAIPMEQAGPIATITIAFASFIGVMIGGPLSDRWVRRNLRGRIYTSAIGLAMIIPALVLMGLGHSMAAAVGAGLCFGIGYGMFDTNNMPILCQFVPARQRATAYGFMNMVGVLAGAAVTNLLGKWADNLGLVFAMMSGIVVLSLALQLAVLRPRTDNME